MHTLMLPFALIATVATATSVAVAGQSRSQTVYLDAVYTNVRTAGPADDKVGHEQIASGVLHDVRERAVGTFAFRCRWIAVLANGDARERCSGWGKTADGRIDTAGRSRRSDTVHTWTITGGTGAYRSAKGTLVTRDVGTTDSLLRLSIVRRRKAAVRIAVVPNSALDSTFQAHADALCDKAAAHLAQLPPFPYSNFDPLHPDPALLPKVGRFFTGPHDPRPTLRKLIKSLRRLGAPPANRPGWNRLLAAHAKQVAAMTKQDKAALAGNAPAFVRSLHDVDTSDRQIGVTALLFGSVRCAQ